MSSHAGMAAPCRAYRAKKGTPGFSFGVPRIRQRIGNMVMVQATETTIKIIAGSQDILNIVL